MSKRKIPVSGALVGLDDEPIWVPKSKPGLNPTERAKMEQEWEQGDILGVVKAFLTSVPRDKLTIADSVHAVQITKAIKAVPPVSSENGHRVLRLELRDHDWLLEMVKQHGTGVLGVNAQIVLEALESEGLDKEEAIP